jgi:hypothetical protein
VIFIIIVIFLVIGCSANCAILERKENFTNLVSSYALSIGYVFYIIDIDIDIDIELKLNWYWIDIDIDIELILSSILRTMVVYIKKKKNWSWSAAWNWLIKIQELTIYWHQGIMNWLAKYLRANYILTSRKYLLFVYILYWNIQIKTIS